MLAVPFTLVVLGYWVMYAGVKRVSLLDAWNCGGNASPTPVQEKAAPGVPAPTPSPSPKPNPTPSKCAQAPGDTKIPLPGNHYILVKPVSNGVLGIIAGSVTVC